VALETPILHAHIIVIHFFLHASTQLKADFACVLYFAIQTNDGNNREVCAGGKIHAGTDEKPTQ